MLFFCKGGEELIDVFISLRNKIDMELTVVSALLTDDYATNTNSNDITRVKNKILSCSDITLLSNINNDDVIELMRSHHVGILLSYAETYGYSVLEFQSTGCPVISTDIRALSEINSDSYGWIINVPKNELGEAIYNTELDRSIIKLKIESQLKKIIVDINESRSAIEYKSERCITRIKEQHSVDRFSQTLMDIYSS